MPVASHQKSSILGSNDYMSELTIEPIAPSMEETEHDVHIFAIVRVKVPGVKAKSQIQAIEEARGRVDFYRLFELCAQPGTECVEFAEEFSHYLVDEEDDLEYNATRWYKDGADGIVMADNNGR